MLTTTPSANDTTVKNIIKQSSSVSIGLGATIEYNINSMVNSPTITGASYLTVNNRQPFKKLFPVESIVKSNRPACAGIKYYINGDVASGSYKEPRDMVYPYNFRTYIAGVNTPYKYYITQKGHGATLLITYPKTVFVNKIVIKFEISHSTPSTWTVRGTPQGGSKAELLSGTSSSIISFPVDPNNKTFNEGTLTLYYKGPGTGTRWSTNEAEFDPSSYVSLTAVELQVGAVTNKYIGIIEIAPKFVKDISENTVSFSIRKESSSSADGLLPVGFISANSLIMSLNNYNQSSMGILSYFKDTTSFAADKIYMYKQAEIKPYFKIFHSGGTYGATNKYDIIKQGTFYIDSWTISEFGETEVTALDGAKILQETISPDVFCENYSITAIIRRVLDSIGFTNYKINTKTPLVNENGVISTNYWWTQDSKTVWQTLQEICKDTQMIGNFDENNVLQFYTRDYLYDTSRAASWTFLSNNTETEKASIVSLSKEDLPSANKIVVRWQSAITSNYEQNSTVLWKSDNTYLGALALTSDITTNTSIFGPGAYIQLLPITTDEEQNQQSLYAFNGYLLIDTEIIEYDAIQYQYQAIGSNTWTYVPIENESDIFKYRALAKPGYANINDPSTAFFRPSGNYRIKTRGALGTSIANHYVDPKNSTASWTKINVGWNK